MRENSHAKCEAMLPTVVKMSYVPEVVPDKNISKPGNVGLGGMVKACRGSGSIGTSHG